MSTSGVRTRNQRAADPSSPLRGPYVPTPRVRRRPPRQTVPATSQTAADTQPVTPAADTGAGTDDDPTTTGSGDDTSGDDTSPVDGGSEQDPITTTPSSGRDSTPINTSPGRASTPMNTSRRRASTPTNTSPRRDPSPRETGSEADSTPTTDTSDEADLPVTDVAALQPFDLDYRPRWAHRINPDWDPDRPYAVRRFIYVRRPGERREIVWKWTKWSIPKLLMIFVLYIAYYYLLPSLYDRAYNAFFRVFEPPGDSEANASRLLVDPFGTKHIPYIANASLTVDTFCPGGYKQEPYGLAFEIAQTIGRTVENAQKWKDDMIKSPESEFQSVARRYNEHINNATNLVRLAGEVEGRLCNLGREAMRKGLAHQQTRALARDLRGWTQVAEVYRPNDQTREKEDNFTGATPADWDYLVVTKALQGIQTHLREQEQAVRDLSFRARGIRTEYDDLLQNYISFKFKVQQVDTDARAACMQIRGRKWAWFWSCDEAANPRKLRPEGGYDSSVDPARAQIFVILYYLKESAQTWENYAKHLDDGLNLLANLPKFMADITSEGIPARISHLQGFFDRLARSADLSAEILEDAQQKKYAVAVAERRHRDMNEDDVPYYPPEPIGCELCDGPRRADWEWASSSSSEAFNWATDETTTRTHTFTMKYPDEPTEEPTVSPGYTKGWKQWFFGTV